MAGLKVKVKLNNELVSAGVSNLWNVLWNGLMEWNIGRSAKQVEPAQIVVLVTRHTLQGPCVTSYF